MHSKRRKSERMILQYCGILLALGVLILTGCPIRRLFGVPCPGCGLTRAWVCFLKGQWEPAMEYHPLFLAAPAVLFLALYGGPPRKESFGRLRQLLLMILSLLFLACYLYRLPLLCANHL